MLTVHHSLITAPTAQPLKWMLFLHGIYGTGINLRTLARRLTAAYPQWGAALVDLRMHGDSQGFPCPHTIAAAAADLEHLGAHLFQTGKDRVAGVLGHSFGGKVALRLVRDVSGDLDAAWIVDSTPGPRPRARGSESVLQVLTTLRTLPEVHPSREAFITTLVAAGFGRPLSQWLAMNLRQSDKHPGGEGLRFHLDLSAIEELLDDYFLQDLWDVVESPPGRVRLHLVIGGKSEIFDEADLARAKRCEHAGGGRVRVHVLPAAGHFVHVDDPDGLFRLVADDLGRADDVS